MQTMASTLCVLPTSFSKLHPDIFQSSTEEAAADIAAFVAIFFEHFTQFKGKAFHMAGESYGVRVVMIAIIHVFRMAFRANIFPCLQRTYMTRTHNSSKPG